jgi:hypothetical protein
LLRLPALQIEVVACSDLYTPKEYIYGMCRGPTCTEVIISAFILDMQLTRVVSFSKIGQECRCTAFHDIVKASFHTVSIYLRTSL